MNNCPFCGKSLTQRKKNFDDIYEGYVIREKETNTFIGINTNCYRVALKEHAAKFTKDDAMEYISKGLFIEKDKTYALQNA